jgi:DNA-binding NtrC family response regulator
MEDDEDFELIDDDLLEEANEHNIESASVPRDYSSRKILIVDENEVDGARCLEVIQDLLTGALVRLCSNLNKASAEFSKDEYDTVIIDLQRPGMSTSDFVKEINNYEEVSLVALDIPSLNSAEARNRFKLEPMRKLFDLEKTTKIKN